MMEKNAPLHLNEIEVFITDIKTNIQVEEILRKLDKNFPKLQIDFDTNDSELSYPCGHTVLRAEGNEINPDKIKSMINHLGFKCDLLEDKACN